MTIAEQYIEELRYIAMIEASAHGNSHLLELVHWELERIRTERAKNDVAEKVASVLLDEGTRIINACGVRCFRDLQDRDDEVGSYACEIYNLWLDTLE